MRRWLLNLGIGCGLLALAVSQGVPSPVAAQEAARTLKIDDFEGPLSLWSAVKLLEGVGLAPDPGAKLAVSTDAAQVKSGKGSLLYSYEVKANHSAFLVQNREQDFTGMKSLTFWVRTSNSTTLIFSLGEKSGASYQEFFYCPGGEWQQIAVNLDELRPDEAGKDPNGKLDLDQIGTLTLGDLSSFIVTLAPEIAGSRTLNLDDVTLSSQPVAVTAGRTKNAAGKPIYMVDNFETPTIRWNPFSAEIQNGFKLKAFNYPLRVDTDVPTGGGKGSLQANYTRAANHLAIMMRDVDKLNLKGATALNLQIKTSRDGTFMVGMEEKDGSRYQMMMELKSGALWNERALPFNTLTIADDSKDENGKLDAEQIKQITIADLTPLLGADVGGANSLYIDQVHFGLAE